MLHDTRKKVILNSIHVCESSGGRVSENFIRHRINTPTSLAQFMCRKSELQSILAIKEPHHGETQDSRILTVLSKEAKKLRLSQAQA